MATLEVADILRDFGPGWRDANAGHISRGQLKVMAAIVRCRSAALGAHVLQCSGCSGQQIAYNSCRDRHCPKCQSSAAHRWMEARQTELLPVEYFHVVFTLPPLIGDIAYQNKAVIYNILFSAASQTLLKIGMDPKHLGAKLGVTAVLHTWGSAMTHHPHLHCIVPGGGVSTQGQRWVSCRKGFFLPVRVLSRLFRRLFLEQLRDAHRIGQLSFYGKHIDLEECKAFERYLVPVQQVDWVVYAKKPFDGPEHVLRYLSRYTHRIAIANSRLLRADEKTVSFKWKDYRQEGRQRYQSMTLQTGEFIRRFLMHVLPAGFHRIRHYGMLSNKKRATQLPLAREYLLVEPSLEEDSEATETKAVFVCRECGEAMIVIRILARQYEPRAPPLEMEK
ncbi:transposase [Chromatiales bacterium (ex Bugula neritina AB1)]|nr:transposase [Chromatiales bacterium (ex Bugula neritina AB1)]